MNDVLATYNAFKACEAYLPLLVALLLTSNIIFRISVAKANSDHHKYIRALRMQETRMRREREELKRERMAWDRDYKIMCERNHKH